MCHARRFVSKYRPSVPVVVITNQEHVARQATVVFGQYAIKVDDLSDLNELVVMAKEFAEDKVVKCHMIGS